jgi:hypothetical protein
MPAKTISADCLCQETPIFRIVYDALGGEFRLEAPGKAPLRLACQAAVSQLGAPDAGTAWNFEGSSTDGEVVRWRFAARQSCWERKFLHVEITPREVLFRVEVEGRGAVDRVTYFAGFDPALQPQPEATFQHLKWARPDWRRNWTGSPAVLDSVFNAQPNIPGPQQMPSGISQRITCATTFGPETFNTFFAPSLYAYVFNGAYCAGVASTIGASRFHHFDYVVTSGWGLELHFDGKTRVDGRWVAPALRLAPCAASTDGLADYAGYLRRSGLAPAPVTAPDWAFRPMVCGWGQQTVWAGRASQGATPAIGTPITPGAGGYASQAGYEEIVRLLDERRLPYGTLTIDMGWSPCLTIPRPDERLWPDMKGFIERLHRADKRVFLWLATWNPGGLDEALRMPHDPGLGDCCDPTNPEFRRRLAEAVAYAVAPDGLNADGFKVDFTGDLPRGGGYRPAGDLWGLDLTHDYLKLIHDTMRNAKGDTVLETHCANPHFADVTEMIRLNDIFSLHEDVGPEMTFRAEMARAALPGLPIDTDNDPFISRNAWLDYLRLQPSLGIPSLYTLTHMSFHHDEPIPAADWDEVRAIWNKYKNERNSNEEKNDA